mmetsp:Transcript_49454/g.142232  ORF Transcript_49454/g.142232 Transcript_49454/m.142232 type:complete len:240 (-) Transcript_49454:651-1370(-)
MRTVRMIRNNRATFRALPPSNAELLTKTATSLAMPNPRSRTSKIFAHFSSPRMNSKRSALSLIASSKMKATLKQRFMRWKTAGRSPLAAVWVSMPIIRAFAMMAQKVKMRNPADPTTRLAHRLLCIMSWSLKATETAPNMAASGARLLRDPMKARREGSMSWTWETRKRPLYFCVLWRNMGGKNVDAFDVFDAFDNSDRISSASEAATGSGGFPEDSLEAPRLSGSSSCQGAARGESIC